MAHGVKNIENRRWRTHHRGEFLIQATQGVKRAYYALAVNVIKSIAGPEVAARVPPRASIHKGGIIGIATLVDVIPPCSGKCGQRWHFHDEFGFVLENMRPLPFVACAATRRGGFWTVPSEVLRALSEATGDDRFARAA